MLTSYSQGPSNPSNQDWDGVFGNVVTGKYQMSLSVYSYTTAGKYASIVDWCCCYQSVQNMLVTKHREYDDLDFGIFTRPFDNSSWIAVIFMSLLFIPIFFIPSQWKGSFDRRDSCFILQTSWWFFFVGISAFYSGAMVMFFTSKIHLQFSSLSVG